MSLPEAIAYARAHQPAIRSAEARLAAVRAEAEIPRAQWYPALGATAQLFGATGNNTTTSYATVARSTFPESAAAASSRAEPVARANYAQADARFQSGLGTSVELADAEAIRTDAEIQLAFGQFELARARAEFGRAIAEGI
jgi:outer membrane protein TolC